MLSLNLQLYRIEPRYSESYKLDYFYINKKQKYRYWISDIQKKHHYLDKLSCFKLNIPFKQQVQRIFSLTQLKEGGFTLIACTAILFEIFVLIKKTNFIYRCHLTYISVCLKVNYKQLNLEKVPKGTINCLSRYSKSAWESWSWTERS